MPLLKINGRSKFFSRIEAVKQDRPGRFTVVADFGTFHVEGGRAAGGAHRDWFVAQTNGNNIFSTTLNATSLVDALNLIDRV